MPPHSSPIPILGLFYPSNQSFHESQAVKLPGFTMMGSTIRQMAEFPNFFDLHNIDFQDNGAMENLLHASQSTGFTRSAIDPNGLHQQSFSLFQHAQNHSQQHQHQQPQQMQAMSLPNATGPFSTMATPMVNQLTPSIAIHPLQQNLQQQLKLQQLQRQLEEQQRQLEQQRATYFACQPTPQSLNIQAGANSHSLASHDPSGQTPKHHHHALDYRYHRMRDQADMVFTPLVSPAVTPIDSQFPCDPQFAMSAAYLSPLTSPALLAQNDGIPPSLNQRSHSSADLSSPAADMDLDSMLSSSLPHLRSDSADYLKRARKPPGGKLRSSTKITQSPISKPQRRKPLTPTPNITAQVFDQLMESVEEDSVMPHLLPQPAVPTPALSGMSSASTASSLSPRDFMSDMPPPPLPSKARSVPRPTKTSSMSKLKDDEDPLNAVRHILSSAKLSPATPASLLKLRQPSNGGGAGESLDAPNDAQQPDDTAPFGQVDTLSLPNPTTSHKTPQQQISHPSTSGVADADERGSAFRQLSMMSKSATATTKRDPPTTTNNLSRKGPGRGLKMSKRRSSISSRQVSPPLRPKISPSIEPFLQGNGVMSKDSASQIFASKSNYERILEGSTVPGVSYPSELSTHLSSKRTSHKMAEQGRRNRINSALQEIAALLPRDPPPDSNDEVVGDDQNNNEKKDRLGWMPTSKAGTVEMAIEYIKQLQQGLAQAEKRAAEAERKLAEQQQQPSATDSDTVVQDAAE